MQYRSEIVDQIREVPDASQQLTFQNFRVRFENRDRAQEEILAIDAAAAAALVAANVVRATDSYDSLIRGLYVWGGVAALGVLAYVGATRAALPQETSVDKPILVEVHFLSDVPLELAGCGQGQDFTGIAVGGTLDRPRVAIRPPVPSADCRPVEVELSNSQAVAVPIGDTQ